MLNKIDKINKIEKIKKKVALKTFGCRANQYDSAVLAKQLGVNQYELVDFDEDADVYIINSCTITHSADSEARQYINRAKKNNPNAITIITGCSAQVQSQDYKKMDGLHYVVGNNAKDQIVKILQKQIPSHYETEEIFEKNNQFDSVYFEGGVTLPKHSRSFLKIQDGCNQFCSFCIVPYARGLNRSVSKNQVMDSLFELNTKGINEVVLTGIHLGTYGKDFKPKSSFEDLLKEIALKKPVKKIRLSSIDPEEVSDEMIDIISSNSIFCRHLHLPLQSGDDGILKKMKRRYNQKLFMDLSDKLIQKMPDICLGTDVIVGFPGEDEAAFENTVKVIQNSAISYVHTFVYSKRKGTLAATFNNEVLADEKNRRSQIVRDLSHKKQNEFYKRFHQKTLSAIIEKRRDKFFALTDNYISVEIKNNTNYDRGSLTQVTLDLSSEGSGAGLIVT